MSTGKVFQETPVERVLPGSRVVQINEMMEFLTIQPATAAALYRLLTVESSLNLLHECVSLSAVPISYSPRDGDIVLRFSTPT